MKRYAVLLSFLLLCVVLLTACSSTTKGYTDVLDDLKKDENFRATDYPVKIGDYSLQVIQIAESDDDELFLYVYQPSGKLEATSVNIAQEKEPETGDTHNFKLELLSSSGTLFKYLVDGITLRNGSVRYYDITSIYRAWNDKIDDDTENDNVIDEVVYEIGQLWTVEDKNDEIEYSMQCVETIEILNPYVNCISYSAGYKFWLSGTESMHSHYVAFDTDKRMDDLLEASVYFEKRSSTQVGVSISHGDWVSDEVFLKKEDTVVDNHSVFALWTDDYEYSRIVKAEDFLEKEKLDDNAKIEVAKTKWVLRFCETEWTLKDTGVVFAY